MTADQAIPIDHNKADKSTKLETPVTLLRYIMQHPWNVYCLVGKHAIESIFQPVRACYPSHISTTNTRGTFQRNENMINGDKST